MAVPVINVIKSFDARDGSEFTFTYTGNQVTGFQYIIYRADTLKELYRNVSDVDFMKSGTTPVKLQATIPSTIGLQNSKKYFIKIRVIDVYGNASDWSNSSYFSCYERPTMQFVGITVGEKVKTQSLTVKVVYSQSQGEKLQTYWFNLYDENLNLVYMSDSFYDVTEVDGVTTLTYTYTNFVDDNTYYIRCMGTTIKGMSCDTGLLQIDVDYKFYEDFSLLYLQNDQRKGRIEYQGNFVIVWPDEYYQEFEYDESYIDLRNKELNYRKGFNLEDNFILWLKGKVPYKNNTFLMLYNGTWDITLESVVYDGFIKFKFIANNGFDNVVLYSDSFPEFGDYLEDFVFVIKKVGGIYQLYVYISTDSRATTLVSRSKPDSSYVKIGTVWIDGDETTIMQVGKPDIVLDENNPIRLTNPTLWIGGES